MLENGIGAEAQVLRYPECEEVLVACEEAGDERRWAGRHVLVVGDGDADFVVAHSVQHLERVRHADEVIGVVEVKEGAAELRGLQCQHRTRRIVTLSRRRCHVTSHSWPAASMHVSTARARSGRMLRIASSALGDLRSK